jgi:hypothetical protein
MEAKWSDGPLISEAEEAYANSSFGDNSNNNDIGSDPFEAWMSDDDDEIPESFEGSLILSNHSSGGLQSMDETLLQESLAR